MNIKIFMLNILNGQACMVMLLGTSISKTFYLFFAGDKVNRPAADRVVFR